MNTIEVLNIKCGGCEKSITSALENADFSSVTIDTSSGKQLISFEGDIEKAKKILSKLGYPEKNSPRAKSILRKGLSYISCAIGRMKK
ncbi:MAG: heavy metal transport/detoxification protein [uncultured bacterium]|nr:MAG: heavy metal transport/detoxification protein [uncultured bacterium]HBR71270.1 heavy metal transporter [Candidatus Moranbacteria bacterium]